MIRGVFNPEFPDYPLPLLRVALYLPRLVESWTLIDFLIDTGATTTSIHPSDADDALGIPEALLSSVDSWARRETHRGVGGEATFFVVPARYGLLDEHDEWMMFDGHIRIAQLTESNLSLPSILGWDILRRFAITLDWSQKIVELR